MNEQDVIIGLEIHVELNTTSKLFCSCPTQGNEEPNSRVCQICLGHPGSKPVLNKAAVEKAIKLCLALNCEIDNELIFSRKNYFYPDLAKNFQITQFERPLGNNGSILLKSGKLIKLKRIHLEEDPASITYPLTMDSSQYVLIDYNRSGNPLCEIVTEPDLSSPEEAREFLNNLITTLEYLKIFEQGKNILKTDVNVSVKETNYLRVEIKNITSFKDVELALIYEIDRQKKNPSEIKRETRSWDDEVTKSLREKETEEEYGYIIEPDLSIFEINKSLVEQIKKQIPELSHDKLKRYVEKFKLAKEDAEVITAELELAELFERIAVKINPVLAAKWLRRELLRVLNYNKKTLKEIKLEEKYLVELLELVENGKITEKNAQKMMNDLVERPFSPKQFVEKQQIKRITDHLEIRKFCEQAVKQNKKAVDDYKSGKPEAFQFLIGQVMKLSRGQADPEVTKKVMEEIVC